jgi:serine protease Do
VDTRGTLVGINSAIFSQTGGWAGISFAIPVSLAKQVLPQLRDRGRVVRGYLGVGVAPVTSEHTGDGRAASRGAVIVEVAPGSPAARAKLAAGDVITSFMGEDVNGPRDLTRRVAAAPPGTAATLRIVRGREPQTVEVSLGELRDTDAARR